MKNIQKLLLAAATAITMAATVNPTQTHAATAKTCSTKGMRAEIERIANKAGVQAPDMIRITERTMPEYFPLLRTMLFPACVSTATIFHEMGHYVVHLAADAQGKSLREQAKPFTAFPNWIRTHKDKYGHERAAHCVGFILKSSSVYTRCPHKGAEEVARKVLAIAQASAPHTTPA
jgi:hypothetical protein